MDGTVAEQSTSAIRDAGSISAWENIIFMQVHCLFVTATTIQDLFIEREKDKKHLLKKNVTYCTFIQFVRVNFCNKNIDYSNFANLMKVNCLDLHNVFLMCIK